MSFFPKDAEYVAMADAYGPECAACEGDDDAAHVDGCRWIATQEATPAPPLRGAQGQGGSDLPEPVREGGRRGVGMTAPDVTPAVRRAADAMERYDAETIYADQTYADEARSALAAALDVEEMAQVLIDHTRTDGIHGNCSCGHIGLLWGHSFAAHQAAALRAAILGGAS